MNRPERASDRKMTPAISLSKLRIWNVEFYLNKHRKINGIDGGGGGSRDSEPHR
jgi:hypothetical protein